MGGYYPLLFIGVFWASVFIATVIPHEPWDWSEAQAMALCSAVNALAWVLIVASLRGLFT